MQLGIRGVDGHIDGTDVQVDDPLGLPFREIGQGGIVAQQKAEPFVVVLDIQGRPHIGRHLIHEAEQTVVGAPVHLVHQVGGKIQSQILPLRLADGDRTDVAVPLKAQHRLRIVAVKPVVQHVHDLVAVDLQQLLACGDPGLFRRGMGIDGCDNGAHTDVLSCKTAYGGMITILL